MSVVAAHADQLQREVRFRRILPTFAAAGIVLYLWLAPLASFVAYSILGLRRGSLVASAVEFFVFETPKVLMLLTAVVFIVGILRSYFTPERARQLLAGRREFSGNVLAALFGVATPFCSCSAVPLFIGFVTAGVPFYESDSQGRFSPLLIVFSFSRQSAPLADGAKIGRAYGWAV